jgi:hypothetical protein
MRFAKYVTCLVILFLLTAFTLFPKRKHHGNVADPAGTIEIHDNQYACYNSIEYYLILVDSTLTIDDYSEHADMNDTNYNPKDLLDEKLSKEQMIRAQEFMASFPWDSLQDKYTSSGNKTDCDSVRQMDVEIRFNSVRKSIDIHDCYSQNMAKVFGFINSLLPENKKIV